MTADKTETFRRECEARHVLSLPFPDRKPYLELVGKKRGEAGRNDLEREIVRQHKIAKGEK